MSKSVLIDDKEVLIRLAHSKITAAQYIRNVSGLSLTDSVAYLNKLISAQPIVEPAKKESMWINAVDQKPVKRHADDRKSEDVLIWIESSNYPAWGYYDYKNLWWVVSNVVIYPERIHYFAYIDNPYK